MSFVGRSSALHRRELYPLHLVRKRLGVPIQSENIRQPWEGHDNGCY